MIRIRETDDLDVIHELDRCIFPEDAKLAGPHLLDSVWWVAEDVYPGRRLPIGYAGLYVPETQHEGFLVRAGVAPDWRGSGIQKRLIRTRVSYAKGLNLPVVNTYVATKNIASMRSLISCEFRPKRYEFTGDNAFIWFERRLSFALTQAA